MDNDCDTITLSSVNDDLYDKAPIIRYLHNVVLDMSRLILDNGFSPDHYGGSVMLSGFCILTILGFRTSNRKMVRDKTEKNA